MGGGGGGGMGGGGMGGGFFAIKDLKLGKNKSKQAGPAEEAPAAKQPAVEFKAPVFGAPAAAPAIGAAAKGAAVKRTASSRPIRIEIKEGADPEAAWNDYFVSHKSDSNGDDAAPSFAAVRETVRESMRTHEYEQVIALINAALRNQQGQPWMFEALGLAMQADQRPMAEIERALMSALDFTSDPTDMMYLAQYLARSGLNARALQLFHQAGQLDPTSPEPFVQGLKLAQRLDDLDAIQWSTVGILGQAWPKQRVGIWQEGFRAAEAALDRLRSEGRRAEAKQYQAELDKALVRDCVVIVSWTGDADVDLFVEEPSGTICSARNPRTTSGGSMLGDAVAKTGQRKSEGASEVYVCPKGFDGTYRVMVRRVWGKLAANKVTVDIYWHYFSKREKKQTKQLELVSDEAVAAFDLQDGRRTEPLAEQQVANAVAGQVAAGRQLLAQQLNALNNPQALGSFLSGANHSGQTDGLGFNPFNPFVPFGFNGAVGYQPVITSLPKGAIMTTSAVISADRRYVRVSPTPFFSGISEVNTFNYVTGASGTSNGAGGGGFGSGGGGGGLGGFGGGGKGGGF